MPQIRDLTPEQLGRHAENVFLSKGRELACVRLAYHALSKNPNEPQALRVLSDVLCGDLQQESGMERFSAAVLEYAVRPGSPLSPAERKTLDDHLFLAKWTWAFARKRNGEVTASWEELQDRSLFVIDDVRYREFLAGVVDPSGSVERAFQAAHVLGGMMGRLLTHKTLGRNAPIESVFTPESFEPSAEYVLWLRSDTAGLADLEAARRKR
jgi:hypothetical protein